MFTIGESRPISHLNDTELQAQQVCERIEEDNREAENIALAHAKATSSTQRPQTCTEAATKYYNQL